jgi:diadenosine tetraphosphatase ApaH/serine/threonine PP2A family protein phosphatase
MKALISDIHGNYEALAAVLKDIEKQRVDDICFLGDVVGYGPDPEKSIDLVEKHCKVRLLGNHDFALLVTPLGFNTIASDSIECHRARLLPGLFSMPHKRHRWRLLRELQERYVEDDILFVHASPRDPVMEYIHPNDALNDPDKIESIFECVDRVTFCGHTHVPGVMTTEPRWLSVESLDSRYRLPEGKSVVNVGSVGQPRDGDPRACYVLLGEGEVEWRRVEYDIGATAEKIQRISGLHERNAERLWEGK